MNNETSNKAKLFSDELVELCRKFDVPEFVGIALTHNRDLWPVLITPPLQSDTLPELYPYMESILKLVRDREPHIPKAIHHKMPDGWRSKDLNS